MAQRVTTAYGPGEVVESIRERGGTKYRVAGEGFSVWLTAAEIPEFGQLQWDDTPDKTWDNSTTLPYNPQPQFYGDDGYSTIQPNQHVDSDKRTSPADSVKFNRSGQPARDLSHLFASREEELADVQARLGNKYVPIPMEASLDTLQARLDNDAFRTFHDVKMSNLEQRGELDPKVGQLWDLMDAQEDVRTAAWADVRKKALRLRSSGAIQLEAANPQAIVATVTGDHGIYDVAVIRGNVFTGSSAVTDWTCSCPWGDWAFDRMTYVGRLCSHAYAALLELQSLTKRKDKPYGWSGTASRRTAAEQKGITTYWSSSELETDPQLVRKVVPGDFINDDDILGVGQIEVEDIRYRDVNGIQEAVFYGSGQQLYFKTAGANHTAATFNMGEQVTRMDNTDVVGMVMSVEGDGYLIQWADGSVSTEPEGTLIAFTGGMFANRQVESNAFDDFMDFSNGDASQAAFDEYREYREMTGRPVSQDEIDELGRIGVEVSGARYPRQDGRLSTEPGANRMDTNYIPFDPTHERIDVTAEREAFLSGESDQKDSYSTSQQYVDGYLDENGQHWHEDVDGPGDNPALTNGDDHVLASGHDTRDELLALPPYAQDLGYLADYYGEESQTVEKALGRGAAVVDHDESGDDVEHLDVEDPDSHTREAATEDSRAWLMGGGGDNEPGGQFDFAAAAQAHLRTAGRQFTLAEQQALIDEEPVGGPLDQSELDLNGTHYLA